MRCWRDCAFLCEREMGWVSTATSVAAFARVSACSLPMMFLCPGAHAISMWCWFEDSRNAIMRERVWRLVCWDDPGTTSNTVWMAAWLLANIWMCVMLCSIA